MHFYSDTYTLCPLLQWHPEVRRSLRMVAHPAIWYKKSTWSNINDALIQKACPNDYKCFWCAPCIRYVQWVTNTICVQSEICASLRKHRSGAKANKQGYFYYWSEKRLFEAASMILHHSPTLIVKIEEYSYTCLKTGRIFSLSKQTLI